MELLPTTFAVEFSNKNHFLSATVSFKVNSLLSSGRRGVHSAAQADNGVINSEPVGHWILSCECRVEKSLVEVGRMKDITWVFVWQFFLSVSSPLLAALINNINQSQMPAQLNQATTTNNTVSSTRTHFYNKLHA